MIDVTVARGAYEGTSTTPAIEQTTICFGDVVYTDSFSCCCFFSVGLQQSTQAAVTTHPAGAIVEKKNRM